jgi:hypothetical protein
MRSAFNCFSCLGLLFILGGGFLVVAWYMFGWGLIAAGIGAVEVFIGLILVVVELILTRRWNKMVAVIKTYETITLQEAAAKTGAPPEKVRSLIYEALSLGELSGRFDGETYTRISKPQA